MSCGCKDKNKQLETVTPPVTPAPAPEVKYHRLGIHCYCGLYRLIPEGLKFGEEFRLVPCPKCGSNFHGRLISEEVGVEELA